MTPRAATHLIHNHMKPCCQKLWACLEYNFIKSLVDYQIFFTFYVFKLSHNDIMFIPFFSLQTYEANKNKGKDVPVVYNLNRPLEIFYRDVHIHTVLPNVTMAILNGWMHSFHHVNGMKMDEIIKRCVYHKHNEMLDFPHNDKFRNEWLDKY